MVSLGGQSKRWHYWKEKLGYNNDPEFAKRLLDSLEQNACDFPPTLHPDISIERCEYNEGQESRESRGDEEKEEKTQETGGVSTASKENQGEIVDNKGEVGVTQSEVRILVRPDASPMILIPLQTYSRVKPKCDMCDYSTFDRGMLIKHMVIHPTCNFCNVKCRDLEDLRSHEETHMNYIDVNYDKDDGANKNDDGANKNDDGANNNDDDTNSNDDDDTNNNDDGSNNDDDEHNGNNDVESEEDCTVSCDEKFLRDDDDEDDDMEYSDDEKDADYRPASYKCTEKLYKGGRCGHVTEDREELVAHQKLHLLCEICGYQAKKKKKYVKHMQRRHPGDNPLTCSVCECVCANDKEFSTHMRSHSGKKPFKCSECEFGCKSRLKYAAHCRVHLKCGICGHQARKIISYKEHMSTHTGEKPFKCDRCEFSSSRERIVRQHILAVHDRQPHACEVCGHVAYSKYGLQQHMARKHSIEKLYQCDQCKYSGFVKYLYMKHMQIHSDVRPFMCATCGFMGKSQSSLNSHMRTHAKENRCDMCNYSAAHKQTLRLHKMMKHNCGDLEPFLCDLCGYKTYERGLLTRHLKRKKHQGK